MNYYLSTEACLDDLASTLTIGFAASIKDKLIDQLD